MVSFILLQYNGILSNFAKQAPLCFELKKGRQWKESTPAVFHSKTVGIVGLDNTGGEEQL